MKLQVRVDIEGRHWNGGAVVDVPEMMEYAFEPMKTCTDAMMAMCTGEMMAGSETVNRVLRVRKDAAEALSKQIAIMLVDKMSKRDTVDGYEKGPL